MQHDVAEEKRPGPDAAMLWPSCAMPPVVALLTFVVYFLLPAFWAKPLSLIPGSRPYIQLVAKPIRNLCDQSQTYRGYVRWQSKLLNLQ